MACAGDVANTSDRGVPVGADAVRDGKASFHPEKLDTCVRTLVCDQSAEPWVCVEGESMSVVSAEGCNGTLPEPQ